MRLAREVLSDHPPRAVRWCQSEVIALRRISWGMALVLAFLSFAMVLPGCARSQPGADLSAPPFGLPVPAWVTSAADDIPQIYAWAGHHQAELQYIPCYCGCGNAGHTNNFECYFKTRDGVAYDYENHGYG